MINKKLYVVGKFIKQTDDGNVWEFQGIFDNKKEAEIYCEGHKNYVIGPVVLNEPFPHETVEWKEAYYPYYKKNGGQNHD